MKIAALAVALLVFLPSAAYSDQEASNVAHVVASDYGRCYAKSVPAESYGQKGSTKVYMVGESEDQLVHEFDWFSQQLYLICNASDGKSPVGVAVVRMGPWARGHQASADHLAVGFYFNGELLAEYSTLDIAGDPDNVSRSVSHYTVIAEIKGFRELGGNRYAFEFVAEDGRRFAFDVATGERVGP